MLETLTVLTLSVLTAALILAVIISQLSTFYGGTVAAVATITIIMFAAWGVQEARNDYR